jgi:hypothetical protein
VFWKHSIGAITFPGKEDDTKSGNFILDSVVLRIMIQDNCFCRVTIDNQIEPVSIGLRKFDGLTSSTPGENECGLVVDINHIPEMLKGTKWKMPCNNLYLYNPIEIDLLCFAGGEWYNGWLMQFRYVMFIIIQFSRNYEFWRKSM